MIFYYNAILVALFGLSSAKEVSKSSNLRDLQGNGEGHKMTKPCTLILRLEEYEHKNEGVSSWDCELDEVDSGEIISFSRDIDFGGDSFESGASTFFGDVQIEGGEATVINNPVFGRHESPQNDADRRRRLMSGTKEVLAIRVKANDVSTTASEATVADKIFGVNGDTFNLVSGFKQCSYDALTFRPTSDTRVTDGVHTVTLNENVAGLSGADLRTKVLKAAEKDLGGSLSSQFDYVMLCLPRIDGMRSIAYAYVNSWLSVYKDEWCGYPSAQMHEIGHNLSLGHSGESGREYDDKTGLMGFSYSQDESPRMCFNNAKNWQLGWYENRSTNVTPLASQSWSGDLIGVAEYNFASPGQNVVVKIAGDDIDYYAGFNRRTGINSGSQEASNQVTVQSRAQGSGYAKSNLVAKLSAGQSYSISNFGDSGKTVVLEVVSLNTSSEPGVAKVRIYVDGETSVPTKNPSAAPTVRRTKNPTASPTRSPTKNPTVGPTKSPTASPVSSPVSDPAKNPTTSPTISPLTSNPTKSPVGSPAKNPTRSPSQSPTTSGPNCSSIGWYRKCNRTPGCAWSNKKCQVFDCSLFSSRLRCSRRSCEWNSQIMKCEAPSQEEEDVIECDYIGSSSQCSSVSGCIWVKGRCSKFSCTLFRGRRRCARFAKKCTWNYNRNVCNNRINL